MTSDSNGEAANVSNTLTSGAYISIAQAKVTRSDGKEMVGVGMNLAGVTEGSISIGGDLNQNYFWGNSCIYV